MASTPWSTDASRSSPIPVSMEGAGSGCSSPSASRSNCMNTRFQISRNSPASPASSNSSRVTSVPRRPSGRRSKWISEQGPQGPVSAICQKLSLSPRPKMRSSFTPAISRHSPRASSSVWCTVTQRRSAGMPYSTVSSSQAKRMASRLK